MGTESMDDVGTILRSILTSEKSGIPLRRLDNEYRTLTGTRIPYRQLGYNTLEEYLCSIPDVVHLSRNAEGNTMVTVVVTESTAHVAEMVRGQKPAKPRPVTKKYQRPSGPHNAGYRPNPLLSRLARPSPMPPYSGDKRRAGYELYHPPQQRERAALIASTKSPHRPNSWSRQADGASNPNGTQGSLSSHPPRSTYQAPPRFQKAATYAASGGHSPRSADSYSRSEHSAAANSVTAQQPSIDTTSKQTQDDKGSSWRELDSSWSKSTFKHSTRSAAEFWEFGDGDSGKQSSTPSRTTAGEACGAGGDTGPSGKAPPPAVRAEPAEPVKAVTANRSLGWCDSVGSAVTSVAAAELSRPVSKVCTVPEKPTTPIQHRPPTEPDQPRFDPFRQSISLDLIPVPPPEHAAAAAVAAAASVPSLLHSPMLPSPAPKELGISLQPRESTATMLPPISPVQPAHTPSRRPPLVPVPSGPLAKPRSPEQEEEYEKPVRGKHYTVDDVTIPHTPCCLLVQEYARREGLTHSYSTMQDRSQRKKGASFWLATLRLGERKFPSYPKEKPTQDEAKEAAAERAVAELGLHQPAAVVAYPRTPATTPEEVKVLVGRLVTIVSSKRQGVLKEGVESLYKDNYSEQLPGNWFEHLVKSGLVEVDSGNLCILYPLGGKATSTPVTPEAPDQALVENGHSSSNGTTNLLPDATGEEFASAEYVDVFVSCVTSTASLCFRFVEYEEVYTKLLDDMDVFFKSNAPAARHAVSSPELAKLYATFYNSRWLRVQPVRIAEEGKVECCFVDEGNSSLIPVQDLRELPKCFTLLPHQAIECRLDGLAQYANCDGVVHILSDLLLGKTLVAEVISREDPVSVVLFDTWGLEDINLNQAVFLCIMTPRIPDKGCVAPGYLSHVSNSGTVWLQFKGPGLDTLNDIAKPIDDFCKGADSMTDDPVMDRVYGCLSRFDGQFYRAVLISPEPLPSGEFKVRHVDYGYEEKAYIAELKNVDRLGDFVLRLPFQAVSCRLRGLTKEDGFYWSADVATQVLSLTGGPSADILIRVTKSGTDQQEPVVELFRRNENGDLILINNIVLETLKQTRCPGLH